MTPIHYTGTVWCVRVPSGAFVARRNGKVFVTGNSGFPKSHNVSKAIDRELGATREVVGRRQSYRPESGAVRSKENFQGRSDGLVTAPATPEAVKWDGFGSALKPAHELIVLARKPLVGTIARNVMEYGTGALNIDATRVGYLDDADKAMATPQGKCTSKSGALAGKVQREGERAEFSRLESKGRWPANLILDGSEEVINLFPRTKSGKMRAGTKRAAQDGPGSVCYGTYGGDATARDTPGDEGSAARFFKCCPQEATHFWYNPKATKADRRGSKHPTLKPPTLLRYLVRLVTPPGGIVLDPFMGTGTTGAAALLEGFRFVGIEQDEGYFREARLRLLDIRRERRYT